MNTLTNHLDEITGPVLRPGAEDFDAERAGFQTAALPEVALLIGATNAADVQAAVRHAAALDLPVGVRATGHALPANRAGGVLISTGRMTGVRIDPVARTAWIEAGVRWGQVLTAAAEHGLAPLSGTSPGVGAVAYTLGGGLGLLSRTYGYAADHVRRIEVVGADGELSIVDAESDPELFWALRGGRDNFGVVTAIEVDLLPISRIYGGGLYFGPEHAADVFDAYLDWTATLPDTVNASIALIPYPDLDALPEPLRGKHITHVRVVSTETDERLADPLRAVAAPLRDTLAEIPYTESGGIYGEPDWPHAYDADNAMLSGFDRDTAAAVLAEAGPGTTAAPVVQLRHLGGAMRTRPAVPNAVGHRDAEYLFSVVSDVDDPAKLAATMATVAPSTTGRFLNYIYGVSATAEHVRTAYEPADYARLTALKARRDPANLFRHNHNIPPA